MTFSPAAYDTISRFFKDTSLSLKDFDGIFTGDLGFVGSELLYELFDKDGIDIRPIHNDCGKMIFDREKQDVHAGGSGCGCIGSVFCGYIVNKMLSGELKHILLCATGALLSPVSVNQGESIPSIAHLIELECV